MSEVRRYTSQLVGDILRKRFYDIANERRGGDEPLQWLGSFQGSSDCNVSAKDWPSHSSTQQIHQRSSGVYPSKQVNKRDNVPLNPVKCARIPLHYLIISPLFQKIL